MALACLACSLPHPRSPLVCWKGASVNFAKKPLDKHTFVCYIILMKDNDRKETYLQGAFMGFLIGVMYLAIFSTILERL